MPDRGKELVRGVSLRQYATVIAGRGDGLPLRELLDFAGVEAGIWPRAEEAWGERLLDDLEADGDLDEALEALMADARRRWDRPLPPLDEDLRAWLDFERTLALETEPDKFLSRMRMRPADIPRLQALWAERLHADPALSAQALAILSEEPGLVRAPAAAPARLREREEGAR